MTDETIFANRHQLADKAVALNTRPGTYRDAFLDFAKWADKNVVLKGAFIDICRLDDFDIFTKTNIADRRSISCDSSHCDEPKRECCDRNRNVVFLPVSIDS